MSGTDLRHSVGLERLLGVGKHHVTINVLVVENKNVITELPRAPLHHLQLNILKRDTFVLHFLTCSPLTRIARE